MRGWLAALRIARREARRARGRSALIVALIGLPVLASTFVVVSSASFRLTTVQEIDRAIGAADAMVTWEFDEPVVQSPDGEDSATIQADPAGDRNTHRVSAADLPALLPAGSRVVPLLFGEREVRTATGVGRLAAEGADLADPIHAGRVTLREGRVPATDREVALTRPASDRLGALIGDPVQTADGSSSWTVVGVVEYPERFREVIVFRPGVLPAEPAGWLVDTAAPVTWDQVRALNEHGIVVRSRAVLLDPPPPDQVHEYFQGSGTEEDGEPLLTGALLAVPALLVVGLLAGAAFAVGARRRARDLALVAVTGGTPAHQRRIVLADGLVLGLAGAVVGIGVGILAASAGLPLLEEHLYGRRAGGLQPWQPVLAGVGGLAVATGLLAALAPAVVAARQSVVAGLASHRGVTRSRKRWLVLGLAMIGLGVGMAGLGSAGLTNDGLVAAGLVAGQLGLVLCTPALVGLVARAGRFLPLIPRIALRDAARNRAAAAPAITAVMAVVAGTLTIGIFAISDLRRLDAASVPGIAVGSAAVHYDLRQLGPDRSLADLHDQVATGLRSVLPEEHLAEVWVPACSTAGTGDFCVGDVLVPEQNACPWESLARDLTVAEQRVAARDERCRDNGASQQGGFGFHIVDDGTALPGLTGVSGDDLASATAALRAGGVVVTDPRKVVDGQATVEVATYLEGGVEPASSERVTVPAYVLSKREAGPTVFLSPAAAERMGLGTRLVGLVVGREAGLTVAQEDAANALLQSIDPNLWMYVEHGQPDVGPDRLVIAAIAAGLVMLVAAAIATGLAAADRRPDLATLGAVGASPRVRRLLSLSQSGVIAGLGGLLGVAAGLGGAFAVLSALNQRYANTWPSPDPYPLEVPWAALAILLLVVPLVAMLGAGLLTQSRLPIERRT